MNNLDFTQQTEAAISKLHRLANKLLAGTYDVTLVFTRTDIDEVGGVVAGTGETSGALEVLENNAEEEDESDLVIRSR